MKLLYSAIIFLAAFMFTPVAFAQDQAPATQNEIVMEDQYMRAQVVEIVEEGENDFSGVAQPYQKVKLDVKDGTLSGQEVEVEHGSIFPISEEQKVSVGETVVLTQTQGPQGSLLVITDTFRLGALVGILILTAVFLRIFFGKSTLRVLSVALLGSAFIVAAAPAILSNLTNPNFLLVGMATLIAFFMLSFVKKWKHSLVLFAAIFVNLLFVILDSIALVYVFNLSGISSTSSLLLQFGGLDANGAVVLYIAGIVIAVVAFGGLVADKQIAYVREALSGKKSKSIKELLSGNTEQMVPYMNKVFILYLFASLSFGLPLFLLFGIDNQVPIWVTANSEFIVQEVVRILEVGAFIYFSYFIATLVAKLLYPTVLKGEK